MKTALIRPPRRYDLDWMRVIAILIVLVYHVGMIFVPWGFHIKNDVTNGTTSSILATIMVWLHQWRMPLLLFISGAGTYLALGFRSPKKFLGERYRRLLFPVIFGMLVIVPPQIYYERIADWSSFAAFYPSIFEPIPYPEGNLSWHHLWFVVYLLFYSVISTPFFFWIRRGKGQRFQEGLFRFLSKPGAIMSLVLIIIATQALLRPYFPDETHALVNDWAYFVYYYLFYLFGFLFCANDRLWKLLLTKRKLHLVSALVATVIMYLFYFVSWEKLPWRYETLDVFWSIARMLVAWFWVITCMGYGQKYLSFKKLMLKTANEGIYPFYILHQTVIIALGYYVVKMSWLPGVKFLVLVLLSFLITVGIYRWFIRPFNLMRFLLGMKPKDKPENAALETAVA